MSRTDADDMMLAYDRAKETYRLAVRLGTDDVEKAFERWNAAREAIIDRLCQETEVAA